MKKAEIDINSLPPLSRRLYQFAIENAGSIYAFSKNIELSQPRINSLFHVSEKTGKYPTIQSDVIEAILKRYDLNTNWLYTGQGEKLKTKLDDSDMTDNIKPPDVSEISKDEFEAFSSLLTVIEKQDQLIKDMFPNKGNDHFNELPNLNKRSGKGPMLKNIPENSENLTQQTITEERSNSIDELIINLVKQTVMNEIPAIIKAVGEVMQGQHAGQNEILTTYLRNQKEISELQIGIIREVVKILAESNPKAKNIDTKIVELTKKII